MAICRRLPWMMTLPSITAAHLERENKLTPEAMADVIAYTRGRVCDDAAEGAVRSGRDNAR